MGHLQFCCLLPSLLFNARGISTSYFYEGSLLLRKVIVAPEKESFIPDNDTYS